MLLFFTTANAYARDLVTLKNGTKIIGYHKFEMPSEWHERECMGFAFVEEKPFRSMANGLYESKDHQFFMVEQDCIFPQTGVALLKSGQEIGFYQDNEFYLDGVRVYWQKNVGYLLLPDGKYTLKNGQDFEIIKGHIPDAMFNDGKIVYQDRD